MKTNMYDIMKEMKQDKPSIKKLIQDFFSSESMRIDDLFKNFDSIMDCDILNEIKKDFESAFNDLTKQTSRRVTEKVVSSKMCDKVKKERDSYEKDKLSDSFIFYDGDTDNPKNNMSKRLSGAAFATLGDPENIFCNAVERVQKQERQILQYVKLIDELARKVTVKIRKTDSLSKTEKETAVLLYKLRLFIFLYFGKSKWDVFYGTFLAGCVRWDNIWTEEEDRFFKDHPECEFSKSPFIRDIRKIDKNESHNENNGRDTITKNLRIWCKNFTLCAEFSGLVKDKKMVDFSLNAYIKTCSISESETRTFGLSPRMKLIDIIDLVDKFDRPME